MGYLKPRQGGGRFSGGVAPPPPPAPTMLLVATGTGFGAMKGPATAAGWTQTKAANSANGDGVIVLAANISGTNTYIIANQFPNGGIYSSTDAGATWVLRSSFNVQGIFGTKGGWFLNKFWIADGTALRTSSDGITWSASVPFAGFQIRGVAYNGSRILLVGATGGEISGVVYSDDGGTNWTHVSLNNTSISVMTGTSLEPFCLTWDGQKWWAAGDTRLTYSTDPTVGFTNSGRVTTGYHTICSNGSGVLLHASYNSGALEYSTDYGSNWTNISVTPFQSDPNYSPLKFGNVAFVPATGTSYGGYWLASASGSGQVGMSTDLTNWTLVTLDYNGGIANLNSTICYGIGGLQTA